MFLLTSWVHDTRAHLRFPVALKDLYHTDQIPDTGTAVAFSTEALLLVVFMQEVSPVQEYITLVVFVQEVSLVQEVSPVQE